MRIWHVLTIVAITAMLLGGQARIALSQTTRPAEKVGKDTTATEDPKNSADKDKPKSGEDESAKDEKDKKDTPEDQPPSLLGKWFLPLMIGMMILLWWFMGRGRRKQRQRQKEMIAALKKGDKVTSIGGIVGTIVEIKGDEITVKVDESSNVRMKFARWAIRGVGAAGKAENPDREYENK